MIRSTTFFLLIPYLKIIVNYITVMIKFYMWSLSVKFYPSYFYSQLNTPSGKN